MSTNAQKLTDIVRGENRPLQFSYGRETTTQERAATYTLAFSATQGGTELLRLTFGTGQYGDHAWTVPVTKEQTAALPVGALYLAVWRNDSVSPVGSYTVRVSDLSGKPA